MALGRRDQDDRDHYCNKRLDLGGPLLANLFRQLFRKLTKDVRSHVQKAVDRGEPLSCLLNFHVSLNDIMLAAGVWDCFCPCPCQSPFWTLHVECWVALLAGKEINLMAAVNKDTITRGLRYSIATGNWGMQGTAGMRAGVSQVLPEPPAIQPSVLSSLFVVHLSASEIGVCPFLDRGLDSTAGHSELRDKSWSLGCEAAFWDAGAEQAHLCIDIVPSAANQLPHWPRGQAGKAAPAAQLPGVPSLPQGAQGSQCRGRRIVTGYVGGLSLTRGLQV